MSSDASKGGVSVSGGIGFGGLLFVVLLALKLTGAAALSWPIVIGSLFAPAALAVVLVGVMLLIAGFGVALGMVLDRLGRGGVRR